MDVLSDALAALRTNRPQSSLVQVSTPWGLRFSPVKGAGFHVVLQGSCWLLPPVGDPIALGPGDVVFLHEGRGHGLADSPTGSLDDFRPENFAPPDPGGAEAGVTRLLQDKATAIRLRESARRRVFSRYSLEQAVASTQRLYDELLDRAREKRRFRETAWS